MTKTQTLEAEEIGRTLSTFDLEDLVPFSNSVFHLDAHEVPLLGLLDRLLLDLHGIDRLLQVRGMPFDVDCVSDPQGS